MFEWVRPSHIIFLGLLGLIFAGVGSTVLVDEQVRVPAHDFVQYTVRVYPGQSIQAAASVHMPEHQEYEKNMIELLIMDDTNYELFASENYDGISNRYKELVGANYWEYLEVDARWFGTIHVILNNRIRVSDRDMVKDVTIRVTQFKPLGYISTPSLLVLIYGIIKWYEEHNQLKKEDEISHSSINNNLTFSRMKQRLNREKV
jgi:hypothetical protein